MSSVARRYMLVQGLAGIAAAAPAAVAEAVFGGPVNRVGVH